MPSYDRIPLVPTSSQSHSLDLDSDTEDPKPKLRPHIGLSEHRARRSLIRYRNLIPTLIVFILTAGLGIAVLIWLLYKLKIPVSEAFRDGHFLVDEGVKRWEGSMESATLRALTATSFISTVISTTSPLLTALIAYRIAYLWVAEERKAASNHGVETGPTPLQYGLLLQVLSASSIAPLIGAARYSMKGKSRSQAPSFFITGVVLVTLTFVLTHLVGLADLWMHTTTSAVLYNLTQPDGAQSMSASVTFNDTLCRPDDAPNGSGYTICLTGYDGWANGVEREHLVPIAQSIISNYSSDRRIITLADAEDIAIAIPSRIDQLATFHATTFGALAKCESLNVLCATLNNGTPNCTHLGINVVPTDPSVPRSFAFADPEKWNETSPTVGAFSVMYGPARCCGTNPVSSVLQLRWASQRSGDFDPPNPAIFTKNIPVIDLYARCNVTFYNTTVAYDGRLGEDKRWRVVPEGRILSANAFASTLAGPLTWQMFTDALTLNIRSPAITSNSTEQVMAALNQELGRLSLGYVAGAFTFAPATDVTIFHPTILGRYQIAPTLTFVSLLLVYGFFALAIFAISLNLTSEVISVPAQLRNHPTAGKGGEISTLELAQLRLLDPLPLVAQTFEPPIRDRNVLRPEDADAKSVELGGMDLFTDGRSPAAAPVTRLRLGLEDTDLRPRYGVWRRT